MSSQKIKYETNTLNNSQEFRISQNDMDIKINISYNEKLITFELQEENIFPKKQYLKEFSLNDLIKIDKIFRLFDSLEEVLNFFQKLINNKNVSTLKENEKEIKIKIYNSLFENYFFMTIPIKESDIKSEMNNITQYIISLNNKINELEKIVNENKKEVNELKKEKKQIENEFAEFKEKKAIEINQLKQNTSNEINDFKIKNNEINYIINEYDKKKKFQ